jgi:hypothetical protein
LPEANETKGERKSRQKEGERDQRRTKKSPLGKAKSRGTKKKGNKKKILVRG